MKMNEIIREQRLKKGYTQEQIATRLGVSTPAVNKWEKGISYPDITLLPALARLLDTDLNTLMSFQDDLSNQEIAMFMNELAEDANQSSFQVVYEKAMQKIKEFPNSHFLLLSVACILDTSLSKHQKQLQDADSYRVSIEAFYKRAMNSDDLQIRSQAQSIMINKYINRKDYTEAELLLNDVVEKPCIDKKRLQARLYVAYDRLEEAARMEEERLLLLANDMQAVLLSLMDIAIKDQRNEDAFYIAEASKKAAEVFDLWKYSSYIAQFELYSKTKQRAKCLKVLIPMLSSLRHTWNINESPLYRHIKTKNVDNGFGLKLQKEILSSIRDDEQTAFLKDASELKEYEEQLESK